MRRQRSGGKYRVCRYNMISALQATVIIDVNALAGPADEFFAAGARSLASQPAPTGHLVGVCGAAPSEAFRPPVG